MLHGGPLGICLTLGIFKSLNPLFWCVVLMWVSHGATWGWQWIFWGCVQARPTGTWEHATLALLIFYHNDSPWLTFAYLNVKIACVLRGTSDSGCGFTSGHFLINSWAVLGLEKTQLGNHHSVLSSVCVQGLRKELLCVGLTFTSLVPWALCEEHHSLVRFRKPRV